RDADGGRAESDGAERRDHAELAREQRERVDRDAFALERGEIREPRDACSFPFLFRALDLQRRRSGSRFYVRFGHGGVPRVRLTSYCCRIGAACCTSRWR